MTIHFICTGNTYRSRLAEAYLRSKQIKGINVISSGIAAHRNLSGPIDWYSQRIIQDKNFVKFESIQWQQTTKELLDKSDFIVFMKYMHLEFCKKELGYKGNNHKVFDINDLDDDRNKFLIKPKKSTSFDNILCARAAEKTFGVIMKKIDDLLDEINIGS